MVRITGDHAGLREVYASALFLDRNYDASGEQLAMAGNLGAPAHRVAFHRGLLLEAQGRQEEAARQFEEALKVKPGWPPAASRLRAIQAALAPRQRNSCLAAARVIL